VVNGHHVTEIKWKSRGRTGAQPSGVKHKTTASTTEALDVKACSFRKFNFVRLDGPNGQKHGPEQRQETIF
jgi:hypothetical protein